MAASSRAPGHHTSVVPDERAYGRLARQGVPARRARDPGLGPLRVDDCRTLFTRRRDRGSLARLRSRRAAVALAVHVGAPWLAEPFGGRPEGGLLQDDHETPGVTRAPDAASRGRDHRAGAGRQDADHRRPVRRHQGGARGLPLLRPTTSMPRSSWRRASRRPEWAVRWRCARSWRDSDPRACLPRRVGARPLQEAFAVAAERWPCDGTPANPRAWLVTTARNRVIDRIRGDRTLRAKGPLARGAGTRRGGRGRGEDPGRDDDPGRAARARLHVLPPGARARCPARGG